MWPENLPREGLIDYRLFTATATGTGAQNVFSYNRPAGARMCFIFAMGGGGGGGGGRTGGAATNRGGGGGGGTSAPTKLIIPWDLLADTLYMTIARGGVGGTANNSGAAPQGRTCVMISPQGANVASLMLFRTGNLQGVAGGGTLSAAGAGGTGEGTSTTGMFFGLGVGVGVTGAAGGAGGSHLGANGVAVTWGGSGITFSGGGGGAGTPFGGSEFNGGAITGAGLVPTIPGGTGGATPDGFAGYCDFSRMLFTGGSGGGTNDTGTGGKGGDGAPGCGGGGGGAGTTGGRGGDGGDGFVIIASW